MVSFASAKSYPSGGPPSLVALADMDGDGHLDIVAAGRFDAGNGLVPQVNVLLNHGDGTFASPVSYLVSGELVPYLAVGDLNGDGKPDVVITSAPIADTEPFSAEVLFNNGDGTLASPAHNPIHYGSPSGLVIADVDGDGHNDLVVAHTQRPAKGGVVVLYNHGDGISFGISTITAGEEPSGVAVGDLNGDGRPDLAVISYGSEVSGLIENLSVLLNQGGETFAPEIQYPAGDFLTQVAEADLNGDGRPDLTVIDSSSNVRVLINRGDGSFAGPVSYGVQHPSSAIALGDVTGDGRIDIVTATPLRYGSTGWVFGDASVQVNGGNAVFGLPIDFADEAIENSIVLGDLNGDGKLDVVATNHSYNCIDSVSVMLNATP